MRWPANRQRWAGSGPRPRSERGSVTVVTAAIVGIMVVLTLGVADLGAALVAREHAQAAQELALPSSVSPQDQAAAFAQQNGATLVACTCAPGSLEAVVEVEVDVGHLFLLPGSHAVRSRARAVVDLASAS
jgi:Putative Flp pilus-assembly TadE/G-like